MKRIQELCMRPTILAALLAAGCTGDSPAPEPQATVVPVSGAIETAAFALG